MGSWTALRSAYAQVSGEVATEIRICTETYHQKTKPATTAQFFCESTQNARVAFRGVFLQM